MWVANNTGNPFVPKEVEVERVRKGDRSMIKVANPLANATILKYRMSVGQTQKQSRMDATSIEYLNNPKVHVHLAPYTRVRVGVNCGHWLQRRDAIQEAHHVGKLIGAQEPSDYEPNQSWPLDEVRLYATMMDGSTFVRSHELYGDALGPTESELGDDDVEMGQARIELLHRLFFRLIDDRYPRISRSDFEDYKKAVGFVSASAPEPKGKRKKVSRSSAAAIEAMSAGA